MNIKGVGYPPKLTTTIIISVTVFINLSYTIARTIIGSKQSYSRPLQLQSQLLNHQPNLGTVDTHYVHHYNLVEHLWAWHMVSN